MPVLTRELLIAALEKTYGRKGMASADIADLSDFVLSFFGYEDYVLDNVLSSAERDVFYNLEEYGFLEPYREEVSIIKGKSWRVNQWRFKKENILRLVTEEEEPPQSPDFYEEVFRQIEGISR